MLKLYLNYLAYLEAGESGEQLFNIYKKQIPDLNKTTFNTVVALDPTIVKDANNEIKKSGTYSKWLLNLYKAKKLKSEDFYKVQEYLSNFEKIKPKLKDNKLKNIFNYPSLPDLAKVLQEHEALLTSQSDSQKRGEIKNYQGQQNKRVVHLFRNKE